MTVTLDKAIAWLKTLDPEAQDAIARNLLHDPLADLPAGERAAIGVKLAEAEADFSEGRFTADGPAFWSERLARAGSKGGA